MAAIVEFGTSKRGKMTVIHNSYEYWKDRENAEGVVIWRCSKRQVFRCKATIRTRGNQLQKGGTEEHTHNGNVSSCLARKAVGEMKQRMTETIATPSSSQGAVIATLPGHVMMALPKRSTLSRSLRRHRQIQQRVAAGNQTMMASPKDTNFEVPLRYQSFVLFDSGPGVDRLMILGDTNLLPSFARSSVWLADGTFRVVPVLFFQLYTIHFEYQGGCAPVALYCLLMDKSRSTYSRLLEEVKRLIPTAAPTVILVDFETAAMQAFGTAFPDSTVTGCYFHLCQNVLRKVQEIGMKADYESDNAIRGYVRCLAALSHVPADNVTDAFDSLTEDHPSHEKMNELLSYFEHTYIRGRKLRGRGDHYGPALFPVPLWNQFAAAGNGIARTTNLVEGWHCGLQSLLMCAHPHLWILVDGLYKDSQKNVVRYLQATAGAVELGRKSYRDLIARVQRVVAGYDESNLLTYLQAVAHMSHQ